jgi:hypothetical protein
MSIQKIRKVLYRVYRDTTSSYSAQNLKNLALGSSELGDPNHTTYKRLFYLSNGDFGIGPLEIEGDMVCQFFERDIAAIIRPSAAGVPLIFKALILRYEGLENLNGAEEAGSHTIPRISMFPNAAEFDEKMQSSLVGFEMDIETFIDLTF